MGLCGGPRRRCGPARSHQPQHGFAAELATEVVVGAHSRDRLMFATTRALRDEGLLEVIEERSPDGSVPYDPLDDRLPVLLVMSDNGPQMSSGSTREFMALCWLATHYGRPGTPTDQAWIESFFGHREKALNVSTNGGEGNQCNLKLPRTVFLPVARKSRTSPHRQCPPPRPEPWLECSSWPRS